MTLRVFHSAAEWGEALPGRPAVLAVGTFDGIHLGHQQILRRVVGRTLERMPPAIAGAVTFHPHPFRVLRPQHAPPLIATLDQRLAAFAEFRLDAALVLKFDLQLSLLSPEEFVRSILVEQLRVAAVLVGENFRFGHRQAGDVKRLSELGAQYSFSVEIVPPIKVNGELVSSTAVRRAVQDGDVARAARLLGRPFVLTGEIQPGAGRGRTVLFPTLNLAPQQELLPKVGVYATETRVGETLFRSATNVGYRPTVDSDGRRITVESHLFDFHERLAAGPIEVRFHHRLRDEMKFDSIEALRAQIARDLQHAREFFQRNDLTLKVGG